MKTPSKLRKTAKALDFNDMIEGVTHQYIYKTIKNRGVGEGVQRPISPRLPKKIPSEFSVSPSGSVIVNATVRHLNGGQRVPKRPACPKEAFGSFLSSSSPLIQLRSPETFMSSTSQASSSQQSADVIAATTINPNGKAPQAVPPQATPSQQSDDAYTDTTSKPNGKAPSPVQPPSSDDPFAASNFAAAGEEVPTSVDDMAIELGVPSDEEFVLVSNDPRHYVRGNLLVVNREDG
jgi:hypothetical protein